MEQGLDKAINDVILEDSAQKKKTRKKWLVVFIIVIVVGLGGVGGWFYFNKTKKEITSESEIDLTLVKEYLENNWDKFNIDGSTSMIPLHQALNDLFGSKKEEVEHSKTVEAFEKFITGDNDILLGVDYSDDLLEKAKDKGVELVTKEITKEGFIFLVNRNNPVKNLTIEQIKDIYSGQLTNWKSVGGDNAPIKAFQRNDDSGSQIRMNKFMAGIKLIDKTYVAEGMGELVIAIAGFNSDYDNEYAIGYNMYTFAEKQYLNDNVALLSVNGVEPNDDSIYDDSYPIVIYNYIYYNKHNEQASEFANNLYIYLMSEEGQKLISESGYVNIKNKLTRNNDVELPRDYSDWLDFYNKEKGEFYGVDDEEKLIIYKNYADFILRNSIYKNNQNAREFLTTLFNADIISSMIWVDDNEGTIGIEGYWYDGGGEMGYTEFFNIRYNNLYYNNLIYYLKENKYILAPATEDFYLEETLAQFEDDLVGFPIKDIASNNIEITKEDLKNLYLKTTKHDYKQKFTDIIYSQPFK